MGNIVKKTKRSINLFNVGIILVVFSIASWLLSSLFLSTYNNSLSIDIQKMNNEIAQLKISNQNLNMEIQTLSNKDRVYVIAQDAGLNQNQDNIISVKGE